MRFTEHELTAASPGRPRACSPPRTRTSARVGAPPTRWESPHEVPALPAPRWARQPAARAPGVPPGRRGRDGHATDLHRRAGHRGGRGAPRRRAREMRSQAAAQGAGRPRPARARARAPPRSDPDALIVPDHLDAPQQAAGRHRRPRRHRDPHRDPPRPARRGRRHLGQARARQRAGARRAPGATRRLGP